MLKLFEPEVKSARAAGHVAPRDVLLPVPDHVHMDLVANHFYPMLLTQLRHGFQLFTGPDLAGGVVRAAQQQNGITRLSQYPLGAAISQRQ